MFSSRIYHHLQQNARYLAKIDAETPKLILIDDQHLPAKERWRASTLFALGAELRPDFICFETTLRAYTSQWLDLQNNRSEMEKVVKHNRHECPNYIAIWNLVRTGLIPDTEGLLIPVSTRALKAEFPHIGKKVVNILSHEYMPSEEEYRMSILEHGKYTIDIEYYWYSI